MLECLKLTFCFIFLPIFMSGCNAYTAELPLVSNGLSRKEEMTSSGMFIDINNSQNLSLHRKYRSIKLKY